MNNDLTSRKWTPDELMALKSQEFISVKDRLPDTPGMRCILRGINQFGQHRLFAGFTYIDEGKLEFGYDFEDLSLAFSVWEITHWLPMPEPPKEKE